jgi:NADPH:quinone reductase-like Zn-dependent oxidoreductase
VNAAYLVGHGGPEVLRYGTRPDPVPGPGEVLVALRAASVNHLDLWVRKGIPGVAVEFPRVPGADGAGMIAALGPGADVMLRRQPRPEGKERLSEGDRVVLNPGLSCGNCEFCSRGDDNLCIRYRLVGEHTDGTWAQAIAVPAANVFPAPARLGFDACAAFPLVYLTAWRMLHVRGRLRPGETVLIHGVGGGVSSAALQIAVEAGARVIVTSSSVAKLSRALALGAERGVDYASEDVVAAVREWTGKRGVDVVVENVGRATWAASLDAVARGGRIVTCGATTGDDPPAGLRRIFWKHLDVLGSTMGSRRDFEAVLRKIADGVITPIVDTVFPLSEAAAAFTRLESGEQFGKIVLSIP